MAPSALTLFTEGALLNLDNFATEELLVTLTDLTSLQKITQGLGQPCNRPLSTAASEFKDLALLTSSMTSTLPVTTSQSNLHHLDDPFAKLSLEVSCMIWKLCIQDTMEGEASSLALAAKMTRDKEKGKQERANEISEIKFMEARVRITGTHSAYPRRGQFCAWERLPALCQTRSNSTGDVRLLADWFVQKQSVWPTASLDGFDEIEKRPPFWAVEQDFIAALRLNQRL